LLCLGFETDEQTIESCRQCDSRQPFDADFSFFLNFVFCRFLNHFFCLFRALPLCLRAFSDESKRHTEALSAKDGMVVYKYNEGHFVDRREKEGIFAKKYGYLISEINNG